MNKVNLSEKFSLVNNYWDPKIVGELNNQYVKIAKLKGEFVWHHHEKEDEFFLVLSGKLLLDLEDRTVKLLPNQGFTVPRGVTHRTRANEKTVVIMVEGDTVKPAGD